MRLFKRKLNTVRRSGVKKLGLKDRMKRLLTLKQFKFQASRNTVAIGVVSIMVVSLFTYMVQINTMATKGFQIRDLENVIEELEDGNKMLELELIDLQSMQSLTDRAKHLNLVEAQEVSYLDNVETTVVQR